MISFVWARLAGSARLVKSLVCVIGYRTMRRSFEEILAASMRGPDECWPWQGSVDKKGYGYTQDGGKWRSAHRRVYQHLIGPIPDGKELDHSCHTADCVLNRECPHRRCVNVYRHVRPIAHRENVLRSGGIAAVAARRTHCEKCDRELAGDNLLITSCGRTCAHCRRKQNRENMARWRASRTPEQREAYNTSRRTEEYRARNREAMRRWRRNRRNGGGKNDGE